MNAVKVSPNLTLDQEWEENYEEKGGSYVVNIYFVSITFKKLFLQDFVVSFLLYIRNALKNMKPVVTISLIKQIVVLN